MSHTFFVVHAVLWIMTVIFEWGACFQNLMSDKQTAIDTSSTLSLANITILTADVTLSCTTYPIQTFPLQQENV